MDQEKDFFFDVDIPKYPRYEIRKVLIENETELGDRLSIILKAYIDVLKWSCSATIYSTCSKKTQKLILNFVKSYLEENSIEYVENNEIFNIKNELKEKLLEIRKYIFLFVKNYGFVKTEFFGPNIWDFIIVYIKQNTAAVRKLVDGSLMSKYNDKRSMRVSFIPVLKTYLISKIKDNNFSRTDLTFLSFLLGQKIDQFKKKPIFTDCNVNVKVVNKKVNHDFTFSSNFVDENWIKSLEDLYSEKQVSKQDVIREVMIISLISLSSKGIIELIEFFDKEDLYLFRQITSSYGYGQLFPAIKKFYLKLNSKNTMKKKLSEDDESKLEFLLNLFPKLNKEKCEQYVINNPNIESKLSDLLETPEKHDEFINEINNMKIENNFVDQNSDYFKLNKLSTKNFNNFDSEMSENLKQKTLDIALKLIYDDDDDDSDVSLYECEAADSVFLETNQEKNRFSDLETPSKKKEKLISNTLYVKNDEILFSLFKCEGPELFEKTSRKSKRRKSLKEKLNWSDEQLEAWYKMLIRNPKKFKQLEINYFYNRNTSFLSDLNLSNC